MSSKKKYKKHVKACQKKKKSMTYSKERKKLTETVPEKYLMADILDRDFKMTFEK